MGDNEFLKGALILSVVANLALFTFLMVALFPAQKNPKTLPDFSDRPDTSIYHVKDSSDFITNDNTLITMPDTTASQEFSLASTEGIYLTIVPGHIYVGDGVDKIEATPEQVRDQLLAWSKEYYSMQRLTFRGSSLP